MKISLKAEYAVRAILDLALHAPLNRGSRSSDIARRTGIPEKFLDAILLDMRKSGLVSSKRGPDGGHWLARDPSRLTVRAVLEAIDGSLSLSPQSAGRNATAADLALHALWERVGSSASFVLDVVTIEDLRRDAAPQSGIDYTI